MRNYLRLSRSLTYSLLFAAPLLAAYELGAMLLAETERTDLRNGADVLLRSLVAAGGIRSTAAFSGVLLGAAALLIWWERRRRDVPLRASVFAGMLVESVCYAVAFGTVVGYATTWLLRGARLGLMAGAGPVSALSVREGVVLSMGAGIFEELVFRVLLVGGLWAVLHSSGLGRSKAGVFAAILAALVFSGFHYVGPYGDPWSVQS
ncbi:MAG TPA: CPBP family glutamic-type intramembrane protease, partial [Longimicrobiaceae bacterium]|nr:CPBP family glutamic-type intramembrane protease [Longimicrobiaceae bacterium]